MNAVKGFAAALLLAACPAIAHAQTEPQTEAQVPTKKASGIKPRAVVTYGSTTYAATESLTAVTGTDSQQAWGFGGEVTFWRGLFAGVAYTMNPEFEGERVFVFENTVYKLGVPVSIRIRPVDVTAGWRFQFGRISPFVAAGGTIVSYEESSSFADATENVSESANGYVIQGGADVQVWRWIQLGGEFKYRGVTGVLGAGGVSEEFGEDQLGGYSAAIRIVIGR
jgi:hypothetical protein